MFKRGDFPGGWKEIKELRSVVGKYGKYEKKIRVSHGTLVLEADDWRWPCDHCGSRSYKLSMSELDMEHTIIGFIVDNSGQTYCPNCKKTMTPKEYEQYILTGEYRKHS